MSEPVVTFVLARADNGVIGRDGALPWHLPADLQALQGADDGQADGDGAQDVRELPRAAARPAPHRADARSPTGAPRARRSRTRPTTRWRWRASDVAVIGGAEVFALFDRADRIELTEVHAAPDGDAVVPPFDGWREVAREDHPPRASGRRTAS